MAEAANGVPKGSVLGPILFLIYVNDLTDYLTIDHLYADNVKLIAPRKHSDALRSSLLMHISSVRAHKGERTTLNSCALSHWLPPANNNNDPTLLACLYEIFYELFSGINAATFPVLIWLFSRLPPGSRRIACSLAPNGQRLRSYPQPFRK